MKKLIIVILTIIPLAGKINAQLFVTNETHPGISTIEEKYYSNSGGKGYRTIKKLDALGRTIEKHSYRKDKLLAIDKFEYNSNNNQLNYIAAYDINNPTKVDTVSNYKYKYQGGRIVYQKRTWGNDQDSIVIILTENKGDSILIYHEKSHYFRSKTNTTDVYEKTHTLKYQEDLLVRHEKRDLHNNQKEITYFEYYPNGRLKRRTIERDKKFVPEGYYMGVPGADDQYYEYKFDKVGRIKTLYLHINKIKYKIATYKYNK